MKNSLFFFQTKKNGVFINEFFNEIDLKEKKNYFNIKDEEKYKNKIESYKKLIINIIIKEIKFYQVEEFSFSELEFLISHWVKRYIYISINRYLNLLYLKDKYYNFEFNYLIDNNNLISKDSFDFINKTDCCIFNNSFCSKLSSYLDIKIKNHFVKNSKRLKRNKEFIKNIIINLFFLIQKMKCKNLIFNTYLPKQVEYKFLFDKKFTFLPSFNFLNVNEDGDNFHRTRLIKKYNNFQSRDLVLSFMISNLFEFLPNSFFEHIQIYKDKSINLFNRNNFKNIITGNHFDHNDLFKLFCIYQKRNFSNLIFIQHGNNYFTDFYTHQSSEIKFSNKFLKWGTEGPDTFEHNFNIKTFNQKLKKNKNNNVLIIIEDLPHKCHLNNIFLNYLNNICMTKELIDQFIYKNITLKIKLINNQRNSKLIKNLGLSESKLLEKRNFSRIMNNYDLIIFNYYSTGFLECVSLNKPALIFNNECKKSFTDKFNKDLQILSKYNLYFNDINNFKSAFNYDISKFSSHWYDKETQNIINNFKKKFSNYGYNKKIFYQLIS